MLISPFDHVYTNLKEGAFLQKINFPILLLALLVNVLLITVGIAIAYRNILLAVLLFICSCIIVIFGIISKGKREKVAQDNY